MKNKIIVNFFVQKENMYILSYFSLVYLFLIIYFQKYIFSTKSISSGTSNGNEDINLSRFCKINLYIYTYNQGELN